MPTVCVSSNSGIGIVIAKQYADLKLFNKVYASATCLGCDQLSLLMYICKLLLYACVNVLLTGVKQTNESCVTLLANSSMFGRFC